MASTNNLVREPNVPYDAPGVVTKRVDFTIKNKTVLKKFSNNVDIQPKRILISQTQSLATLPFGYSKSMLTKLLLEEGLKEGSSD